MIVGIDLGTTNSAVAAVINGEISIALINGQRSMPSAVGLDAAGRLLIGQAAKNQQVSAPESTVLSVKRLMGTDKKVTLGQKTFSPEEISALILGELKRAAETQFGSPITKAVITVPAFFNEQQRKATQVAGQLAGLEVVRIINEPTAAALAYGANASSTESEMLLVYDLGGGTFDVSLVCVENGIVEVKASHGDTHLGGDDFDNLLADHAVSAFSSTHGEAAATALTTAAKLRLKGVMEQAKISLSDEPFAAINEEYLDQSHHLQTEITRNDYEAMIGGLLEKTLNCVQRTLADAKITASQITKVMLVGGATRTPAVYNLLYARLKQAPRHEIDPDLIVAMGAAIQGASLAGTSAPAILIDITAHTYSTEALAETLMPTMLCVPIIPRGTPLPVRKAEVFYTVHEDQSEVEVLIYQGEGLRPQQNLELGRFMITGLSKAPAGSPILLEYALDLNGLLTVTAREKETRLSKTVTIDTRGQHRLNLDVARANLASLFADYDKEAESMFVHGNGDADDDFEDDVDDEDEDGDEEIKAGGAAPPQLLASAKSLRQRAEALLLRGVAPSDVADINARLSSVSTALQQRDWPALLAASDGLSDVLFYLED